MEHEGYRPAETAQEQQNRLTRVALAVGAIVLVLVSARFWDDPPMWAQVMLGALLLGGIYTLYQSLVDKTSHCISCGEAVGTLRRGSPAACARCGGNRYTTERVEQAGAVRFSEDFSGPSTSASARDRVQAANQAPSPTSGDVATRLRQLEKLRAQNLISTEEYQDKRQKLLQEL